MPHCRDFGCVRQINMKNFLLAFVISVLFVICLADTFPRSQLKKACKLKNGEDGTFELISKCDQARLLRRIGRQEEVEPVGVVRISRESVVCCAPRVERRPVNSENLTQSRSSVEKISYECFPYCLTLDNEIVSGEKAGAGDFPHMAAVGYFDDKTNQTDFKCGGSLISDRFVLTAAHCCSKKDESPYIVRLGRVEMFCLDEVSCSPLFQISDVDRLEWCKRQISAFWFLC